MKKELNFGQAIEALKQGKRASREGWNGKGMFIFERPADELEKDFLINNVKSLPQSVKDFFQRTSTEEIENAIGLNEQIRHNILSKKVRFGAYLCMYAADGSIVNGWLASQTDILATDWCVLDE
jgi:hypothetical protein